MACISRVPQCGNRSTTASTPTPFTSFVSIISMFYGIGGIILGIIKSSDKIKAAMAFFGAPSAGVIIAIVGVLAVIVLVGMYAVDRCIPGKGLPECVAGAIGGVVESFSGGLEKVFPFIATHKRVDVVVRSRYWNLLESSNAFVHCTDNPTPRRSEVMRCYFFTSEVCAAARGSVIGAAVGGSVGFLAAAHVAAAFACATAVLCAAALIAVLFLAIAFALAGASVGGQIGRSTAKGSHTSSFLRNALVVGNLVSIRGRMSRREHDNTAWVMWMSESAQFHGKLAPKTPSNPFSYCEIDDQLVSDSCPMP